MTNNFPENCGYIRSFSGLGLCVYPKDGQRTLNTEIVPASNCDQDDQVFCFPSQLEGEFKHRKSGLCIQPESGEKAPDKNEPLVLNNCGNSAAEFQFTTITSRNN